MNGREMRMRIGVKAIRPTKMRQHGNPKAGMNGKEIMMSMDIFPRKNKERKGRKRKRKEGSWTSRSRKRTR